MSIFFFFWKMKYDTNEKLMCEINILYYTSTMIICETVLSSYLNKLHELFKFMNIYDTSFSISGKYNLF